MKSIKKQKQKQKKQEFDSFLRSFFLKALKEKKIKGTLTTDSTKLEINNLIP